MIGVMLPMGVCGLAGDLGPEELPGLLPPLEPGLGI